MDGIDEIKEIFTDEDTQALIHIAIEAACDSLTTPIPQVSGVLYQGTRNVICVSMGLMKSRNYLVMKIFQSWMDVYITSVCDTLDSRIPSVSL